jgi:hypothetical protein
VKSWQTDRQTDNGPSDGNSSGCLWQGELKIDFNFKLMRIEIDIWNLVYTCTRIIFKFECRYNFFNIVKPVLRGHLWDSGLIRQVTC